jgi:hypothetical protein
MGTMNDCYVCLDCLYTTGTLTHALGHEADRGHHVILESDDLCD